MRQLAYALSALILIAIGATASHAADLGKPATASAPAITAADPIPNQWIGAYVETGLAAQYTKAGDKNLVGKVGLGYNLHTVGTPYVTSLLVRYGFSAEGHDDTANLTFDQPITGALRFGYLVQPSTLLYGLAGYSKSINSDFKGPVIGLGAEMPILGSLRLGIEYDAQFARDFRAPGDVVHEIGVFARIPF